MNILGVSPLQPSLLGFKCSVYSSRSAKLAAPFSSASPLVLHPSCPVWRITLLYTLSLKPKNDQESPYSLYGRPESLSLVCRPPFDAGYLIIDKQSLDEMMPPMLIVKIVSENTEDFQGADVNIAIFGAFKGDGAELLGEAVRQENGLKRDVDKLFCIFA